MKAIAVIDKNRAIGNNGGLLFRLPSDLRHFKEETIGKTCIMGRKTLESMPGGRPLKGRNTVVVSRSLPEGIFFEEDGFIAVSVSSKEDAIKAIDKYNLTEAVVCGGAQIYELFLSECSELILTEVEEEAEYADAYFPDFQKDGRFEITEESAPQSENGHSFKIRKYKSTEGESSEREGSERL